MTAVIARILLRVIAGVFIGHGMTDVAHALNTDPDAVTILTQALDIAYGATVWGVTEVWYWAAKKFGWRT